MNFVYGLIAGIAGAAVVCWVYFRFLKKPAGETEPKRDLMDESKEKHAEMIGKAEEYIKSKSEITNDEIQNLLGVSDASAERYLHDLETQGKLKQIGVIGHQVKYQVL